MKAWARLVTASGVVLLALVTAAGASAAPRAHRRHIEVRQPTTVASLQLGTDAGYEIAVTFDEPDLAVLAVRKLGVAGRGSEETRYGAHFHGSLVDGRVTADFGTTGALAVRFRPRGPARERPPLKGCEGKPFRSEPGRWVGKVAVRGEGGYFAVSTGSAAGERYRTFRLRCRVESPLAPPRLESLRERIEPHLGVNLVSLLFGTVSSLQAVKKDDGRLIDLWAAHAAGSGPGSEVEAGAFEYQGQMPVGRTVQVLGAPAGSLLTTLPGERPAAATLRPGVPFKGEARYVASAPTVHLWTGTLAVGFPGLEVPLAGPGFYSSLCVVSPLLKQHGCEFQAPSLEGGGESAGAEGRR